MIQGKTILSFIFGAATGVAVYHYGIGHGGMSAALAKELSTIQFVYSAADHVEDVGLQKATVAFNTLGSPYDRGGNYLYGYIYKGKNAGELVFHGNGPFCVGETSTCAQDADKLIGKNFLDKKFGSAGYLAKTNIDIAKNGGGWVPEYCWKDPVTGQKSMKKAFVLPVPNTDVFVASGYHTGKPCK